MRHDRRRSAAATLVVAALCVITPSANAQLVVNAQTDLQQLAASITGPGVTISNPVITCHGLGYGEFSYSGSALSAEEGVILTTGRITDAIGPNNNGGGGNWFAQGTPGDPVLNAVTGRTTMDACKFEFDIIPTGDSLSFNFVFASEEYNEWVGSQYNDVFGFYISGPGIVGDPNAGSEKNIALIPGGNQPVTINTVNNGSNSAHYFDNAGGATIQYDGFTQDLVARSAVTPCQTYHLKLIIADASDRKYDSGVFIEKIESNNVTMQAFTANGTPELVEGCNPGWVRFERPFAQPTPLSIQYYIQGSATNGADYTAIPPVNPLLPKSIVIPANQTYVDRAVSPLIDGLNENTEELLFILGNPFCPAQNLDSLSFPLLDTLFATVSPGGTICAGGSWPLQVTGGSAYSWSPTTGLSCTNCPNPAASPTSTTTYVVTISDGSCTRSVGRQVRVSNLALSAVITAPLCNGQSNGAINLSTTGGVAPYTYSWVGPNGYTASTQDLTGLSAGTYTVTVTDDACTRTQSFTVLEPGILVVDLEPAVLAFGQNISCHGGSDGAIDATITGGTGPYAPSWSGPNGFTSTSADLSGLMAGTYTLNVSDANGCTASSNVTLVEATPVVASIAQTTAVVCSGDGSGSATASAVGGIPPYSYAWNTTPPQSAATATALTPGTWTVTVSDGYGCTGSATASIGGPTSPITITTNMVTHVRCFGASTGSATVAVSGGTPPHAIAWNTVPAQSGATAINLPAGTWTATVTDGNGCTAQHSVTINQPAAALSATEHMHTDVLCHGNTSGSATVAASGGTGPYAYSWNSTPAQNGATALNLPAGTWTCTVTDVNLCTTAVNVTIGEPATALTAVIATSTPVLCHGASTGSATVSASGGTGPYTYSWNTSPVQSTASASDLAAGTWTCTVTDANGCTTTAQVTITQPAAPLQADLLSTTPEDCFGDLEGTAVLSVTGGSGSYAVNWSTVPPQNGLMATGLAAGTYTATISDQNGCPLAATVNATIGGPTAALALSASTVAPGCAGGTTGSIDLTVSGGTAPMSYAWTGPGGFSSTSADLAGGLIAGTYAVTVTDAHGCTANANWILGQPTALSATATVTDLTCRSDASGAIAIDASGGTGAYGYAWSGPNGFASTAEDLTGLAAGAYTLVLSDANGCSFSASWTVSEPAQLNASITAQTAVTCHGGATGSATAGASGGTAPYTFQWNTSPTQNTATASGLSAGTWTCTVIDAHGCTTTVSATVGQPAAPVSVNTTTSMPVSCFGGSNGSATVGASGGTGPYAYAWNTSPAQQAATANNLPAGTWSCTVTDANGCTAVGPVTITQPAAALAAAIDLTTPAACFGDATGTATVSATGGTTPYSYSWNTNPVQSGTTATSLASGTWTCTVTDAQGCVSSAQGTVGQPAAALGTTATITAAACQGANNGAVDITTTGGTAPYTHDWTGPGGFTAATADISGLAAGVYQLTVTDANGCVGTSSWNVNQPGLFSVNGAATTYPGGAHVSCPGAADGSIAMTVSGATPPYTFAWTGPNGFTSTAEDISGLSTGTYTFTVTDDNGCATAETFTLSPPPAVQIQLVAADLGNGFGVSCFAAMDGSVDATILGGVAPIGVLWTGPNGFTANTPDIGGLAAGAYALTVSDANGCQANAAVVLTEPAALVPSVSSTADALCHGGATGAATATVTGGVGPHQFAWNTAPAQLSASAAGLAAGNWTVTVTDANGCAAQAIASIGEPAAALSATIDSQTDAGCLGAGNGSATVNATGGTAPYTYTWNTVPVQSGATATGLGAGTWTCTVTDDHGCSTAVSVTIGEPALALNATATLLDAVACHGGNDGSAVVNATGGTAPYSYSWNTVPAQLSATATGLSAGVWTCTVTDANGCIATASVPMTQPAASLTAVIGSTTDVACAGNTGSATVNVSGGTAPYATSWNTTPVQTGATATDLSAGTWTCTVTDANGCITTVDATIGAPAGTLTAALISTTDVGCFGQATGAAEVAATLGTAPYSYAWNTTPAQHTPQATGLAAGTYLCTVIDDNGCTALVSATIHAPATALATSIIHLDGASCFGLTDGAAEAAATGGTGGVSYSWNSVPVQTGATLENVGPGTYVVTATDANGCTATAQAVVTAPAVALGLTTISMTDQSCFGSANGQATVNATGGTAPYTYAWNTTPIQFGATANGLAQGTWTATATDANGCTASTTVTIGGPAAPLSLTASTVTDVLCHGANTGTATVIAAGGTAPYSITWNSTPVQTGGTASNLIAGSYTASVQDANGCSTGTVVTITQPAATIVPYVENLGMVSCHGGSDGFAEIEVTGGSGNFSITWNTNPVQTGALATGLAAGTWTATVVDNNGCAIPKQMPVTITQPASPLAITGLLSDHSGTNVSCNGGDDGAIDVTVSGGTWPYNYFWSDQWGNQTGLEDVTGLSAGAYTLMVSDGNGCTTTAGFTLTEPAALDATAGISPAACQGAADGAIDLNVTGGTAPYLMSWSGPNGFSATTADLSGLAAGAYTVLVTDANGCSIQRTYSVMQPGLFTITAILSDLNGSGVSCAGATDGSIALSVSGATAPYTFAWSGPNGFTSTDEDLTNLAAGSYTVTVTDANGCSTAEAWTLSAPATINVVVIAPKHNGSEISCVGGSDGAIDATVFGGTAPFSYAWSGPNGYTSGSDDISGLTAGTYTLTVTDANGCTDMATVVLEEPAAITSTLALSQTASGDAVSCHGANDGSIDLSLSGGSAPLSVSWSGPNGFTATGSDLSNLMAGTYTATVVDANGCVANASATLTEPDALVLTGTPGSTLGGTAISCAGGSDGSIDLDINGGAGGATFQWTGPNAFVATAEDPSGLSAGTYTVSVLDANGCTASASFLLDEPAALTTTQQVQDALCQGNADGSIDLTPAGGIAPMTFSWSGPNGFSASSEDIANVHAGVYVATITDANGCTLTQPVNVQEPGMFVVSSLMSGYPGGYQVSCAGASNGSLDIGVTGGTPGYQYSWTGPNGYASNDEDIMGVPAGNYFVIITDVNGCSHLEQYSLVAPAPLNVGLLASVWPGGANTSCDGATTGSIDATIAGGLAPYTVSWSGPNGFSASMQDPTGLAAGTYAIQVTDIAGCTAQENVTLTAPAPVDGSITTSVFGGGTGVSCDGASDGSLDLSAQGGTAPYSVIWSGPNGFMSNDEDPSGLGAGDYTATITDMNGCTGTITATLTAPAPITLDLQAALFGGGYTLPCAGSEEGSITATVTGGLGTLHYAWTGPGGFTASTPIINGSAAGTYTVIVSDDAGCSVTQALALSAPPAFDGDLVLSDAGNGYQVGCGAANGSIDLTITGGLAPYQIDWTGPNGFTAATEDLNALAAGTYVATLVDANGCIATEQAVLTAPQPLQAALSNSGTVCDGGSDGTIDLEVSGGVLPYTYTWTGPGGFSASSEDLSGLVGGTYSVTVLDAGSCSGSWSTTMTASAPIELSTYVSLTGTTNIACTGDSSGVIAVLATGGSGPLDLLWSGPNGFTASGADTLTALVAGTYMLSVTDANGCQRDTSFTLTEPAQPIDGSLTAQAFPSGTNISCLGGSDGSIDLTISGGSGPYTFDWRGPDSTNYSSEDLNGVIAGDYEVVITDANQCATLLTITLTEPDSALAAVLDISTYNGFNTSCDGVGDAVLVATVTGGNGGAQLNWSGPNGFASTADSLTGLAAGSYTLTVTDMNGCVSLQDVVITAPDPVDPQPVAFTYPSGSNTSCAGVNDGLLIALAGGGAGGYTYLWTGPGSFSSNADSIAGLGAGTYCLTVTDANGCSAQACTDLIAASAIDATFTATAAGCGQANGAVDVSVTGGGAPYTFAWAHGSSTEDIAGLTAGTYEVSITDLNGCIATLPVQVEGGPALSAEAVVTNASCLAGATGSIDLSVTSGTMPYSFLWNTGSGSEDMSGLAAGTYTVTVSDAAGCTWNSAFTVNDGATLTLDSLVVTYSNGYNLSGHQSNDGSITITPDGGTAPYSFAWSNGADGATVQGLAAGTYTVTITDANGCSITVSFTLDQPMDVVMPTGYTPNGDGSNDSFVVQGLEAYPDNRIIIYNRWGNVVYDRVRYTNDWSGENLQGEPLPNGTYFVVLTLTPDGAPMQNYVDLRR
ncbi:MAG TPA: choice-of-anchor L domain-containing protein [Flavobacteriales bacterium]|nr:choice-of-anchor L domain-containing protein [Flavobacteriales bacterium]